MHFFTHAEVRNTCPRGDNFELNDRFLYLRRKSVSDCAGLQYAMAAKCNHPHPGCR